MVNGRELFNVNEDRVSLRRYPWESGLAFNQTIPAKEESVEVSEPMPASNHEITMTEATLYLAGINKTKLIGESDEEVTLEGYIPAGKYDMIAKLVDNQGRMYAAYYVYMERIND